MSLEETLPYEHELVVQSGTFFPFLFRWVLGGQPVDWTGWDAYFNAGKDYDSSLFELTVGNGIEFQEKGLCFIYMTEQQTTAISEMNFPKRLGRGSLKYNLMLQDPLGRPFMFIRGNMYIEMHVRRLIGSNPW